MADDYGVNSNDPESLIAAVIDNGEQAERVMRALSECGYAIVPKEPTELMLNAARDWSIEKYGRGVGNDGAIGCYRSMIAAST